MTTVCHMIISSSDVTSRFQLKPLKQRQRNFWRGSKFRASSSVMASLANLRKKNGSAAAPLRVQLWASDCSENGFTLWCFLQQLAEHNRSATPDWTAPETVHTVQDTWQQPDWSIAASIEPPDYYAALIQTKSALIFMFVPVEEKDVVWAGQSLQQDLLLRDGVGRVELHPDELPHVLVHQADAGAVDDVSDVGRDPANARRDSGRGNRTKTDSITGSIRKFPLPWIHPSSHSAERQPDCFPSFLTEQSRVPKCRFLSWHEIMSEH